MYAVNSVKLLGSEALISEKDISVVLETYSVAEVFTEKMHNKSL